MTFEPFHTSFCIYPSVLTSESQFLYTTDWEQMNGKHSISRPELLGVPHYPLLYPKLVMDEAGRLNVRQEDILTQKHGWAQGTF